MNPDFWRGKKVLITGHTGFKGSWLSLWLQTYGANVVGLALPPPTQPSLFEEAGVERGMTSIIADIRKLDNLREAMHIHQPEIVIHMAAQPLVRHSYVDPIETYETNVMGTAHVLESARLVDSVRALIVVTTDKCYLNREWFWAYREDEPLGGRDPYSSSKACSELVTAAYRDSFLRETGVHAATVRAGNVIGGGDWAKDRLVPDIAKCLSEGQTVPVRNPNATRPWQHVLEPLHGYIMLAEQLWQNPELADAWNFGPDESEARPVSWVVDTMTRAWGDGATWQVDEGEHPHEATYLKVDSSRARALLDWFPRLDLTAALSWTVEWYQGYYRGDDARALCEQQMARYEKLGE